MGNIIFIDLFDVGGVLDRQLFGASEVTKHIIASPMASWAPFDRISVFLEAAGATHYGVDVYHFK